MMKILVIGLAVLFLVGCVAPQEQSSSTDESYRMNTPPFTPSSPVGSADRYASGHAVVMISPPELGVTPPPRQLR